MSRRSLWRAGFLGLTALVVGMEVYASADGSDETEPWTDLLVAYVPGEVTALGIAGLTGWLAVHFAVRYIRKAKEGRAEPVQ